MSEVEFLKMSASGNDFVLIDNRINKINDKYKDINEFISKVCRRRHSVGADGVILIEESKKAAFSWRFFNADGSEAEMCGNGGRCAARFAFIKKIAEKQMTFETIAGIIRAEVDGINVKLQLTTPFDIKLDYPIKLEENEIFLSSVNTGVPHAIISADNIDHVPVEELGRAIRYHKAFGENGTNVDFVKIINKKQILLRTYERGVEGETYACGTGAVAAGVILKEKGLIESPVDIGTKGGEILKVYIEDKVYLEGKARIIYAGILNDEALL